MQKIDLQKKEEKKILIFSLGNEELGLDISCVREVLRPQEIYPLPRAPQYIKGVINLRGHIIALLDLKRKLCPNQTEEDFHKRIIICKVNHFMVGLTVNHLKEIVSLSKEEIQSPPEVVSLQMEAEVISGLARVGERIIPILNLEHILTRKEVTELAGLEI